MKAETIQLIVNVRINYDEKSYRKVAIRNAKECVLSTSILGSVGAVPKSAKVLKQRGV